MQSVLSQVEVFQFLPQDALASLSKLAEKRTFRTGSELMRQGEPSATIYVITRGRVKVERSLPGIPHPVVLTELGRGEMVGEMGVLDGEPSSATVTALETTEVLEFSAPTLVVTVLHHPETAKALLQMLSRRLRSTDELAVQLLRNGFQSDWRPG